MEKRIKNYLSYAKNLPIYDMTDEEKRSLRSEMLVQIGFFQHERLVHLIVMVLFALMAIASFFCSYGFGSTPFYFLTFLFLILLIPYVRHYYILENGVQKLYEYYDLLLQSLK